MKLLIDNLPLLVEGMIATLQISIVTLIISTIIGFACGIVMTMTGIPKAIRWLVRGYVELLRAIPLIVNVYLVFFVAPLMGLALSPYLAVIVSLSMWGGANGAEIVRGGLKAVPTHQWRSARALGLREDEIMTRILLPQALRSILPAYAGLLVLLIQSTTLAVLLGVPEFLSMNRLIVERTTVMEGQDVAFQVYAFVLIVYFVLCSILTFLARRLERHFQNQISRTAPTAESVIAS